jgi:hypothetical protein
LPDHRTINKYIFVLFTFIRSITNSLSNNLLLNLQVFEKDYIWGKLATMNGKTELLKRLLKLYPVKSLKDNFTLENKKQDEIIDEIVESNTEKAISKFAVQNFNLSKQHIYVFTHGMGNGFKTLQSSFIANVPIETTKTATETTFYYFLKLPFTVIITNPIETKDLYFHWPCKVTIDKTHLYIQFIIIEKNVNSYFDKNRKVIDSERKLDENNFVDHVIKSLNLAQSAKIHICDLNKGVKKLWDTDVIDSKYVKFKKSKSTSTEAMDESYTVKKQYPDVYEGLINAPLGKTIFKFINDVNQEFCDHFTIEPNDGKISIPIFPDELKHVDNVVKQIIQHN